MGYNYRSRRTTRKLARQSQRNFIITLVLVGILIYSTITWVLPFFIGSIGFIQNITNPPKEASVQSPKNSSLAPPVLTIPFEAANTPEIDIKGYGTADSKVKLYIDDEPRQTIKVSEDGSFVFEQISLSLGINNIYAKSLDDNDKESLPSKTIKLIYDNEKPDLNISEPEDGRNISGGDKKVRVSGKTEPGAKVFINDAQVIVNSDGDFSTDHSLNDGDNFISIKAQDLASNTTEIQRKVTFSPENQETQ